MPFIVQSPYSDDETRTKLISQMLEEFIQTNWNQTKTTVPVDNVAFGIYGDRILQSGKDITLRAYSIFENAERMTVDGKRWRYDETDIIDIYVLNNETETARDPRAIAIMKWLEELFIIWQGKMVKGIYEVSLRGARLDNDPFATNMTRIKLTVNAVYVADIVEV